MAAGQKLKLLRNRRNITGREVEQASERIAEVKGDKRFRISNGWLAQLENGASEPSICKLFSLGVIYHANILDLLRLYNIDVEDQEKYESIANPHLTQLLPKTSAADGRLGEELSIEAANRATSLLSEVAPRHPSAGDGNGNSHIAYGYVGSTDLTMYPLIRPGSLLQIDTSQTKLHTATWHNEFERPIFFIELRGGYACGWCELQGNQLLIVPHPSSPATIRRFTYPREAEIVGRVIGYHTRCVDAELARDSKQRSTSA